MTDIRDIVSQILESPELRQSLENTVRSFTTSTPSTSVSSQNQAVAVSTSLSQNCTPLRQELRSLFPSVRERNSRNRVRSRAISRQSIPVTFCKDVILLKSPQSNHTLRASVKAAAYETGFAISAAEFQNDWCYAQIQAHLRTIFSQLNNVDFELVLPVGGRLTKIVLQQGMDLNGHTLRRLYNQKIIYVRPFQILDNFNSEELEEPNSILEMPNYTFENIINTESNSVETGYLSLEDILRNLQLHVKETVSHFNVYRQDIFQCCIRAMQRKSFDPFNKIDVKFSDIEGLSEGAIDVGGPTREMFRLVLAHIKSSKMFIGGENKFLTLNSVSLEKNEYFYAGQLIALSLLHGGPGPHFFSDTLFMALVEGTDRCTPSLGFLDYDVAERIQRLLDIDNLVDLQECITTETLFAIAGVYGINNISQKHSIIQETMKFYNFHRVRPALDQFVAGLKTCNIYNVMVDHPDSFKKVMCEEKPKLTSTIIQDTFEVIYNEIGSNMRQTENRAMAFFRDYLLDCEENEVEVSLTDLLTFATGADTVPPLGFPMKPKLLFLHESTSSYPKANTCGLELHLPVVHHNYMDFKYNMDFGIGNSKDFAFA